MIEDEVVMHEPRKLRRYLLYFLFFSTVFAFRRDFRQYYANLSSEEYRPELLEEPSQTIEVGKRWLVEKLIFEDRRGSKLLD
jgi:hypothetical protein